MHPTNISFSTNCCPPPASCLLPPASVPLLGLTGGIACGKSSVARLLAARGAIVLDADAIVHELYAEPKFAARVAALFEADVRRADGTIDRAALGRIVFADKLALRRLETLVHPAVAALRDEKLRALNELTPRPPAVVLEAVKLIEAGQAELCALVWCVVCEPDVQLRRLMTTRGLSEADARARLANQPSLQEKIAALKDIPLLFIENNGTEDELQRRVDGEWTAFLKANGKHGY